MNQIEDYKAFQEAYPHQMEVKVAWGDMDALGHINNVLYFRYFESARIDYFLSIGDPLLTSTSKTGPILAYISSQFLQPVVFPDTLYIGTTCYEIGTTSLKIRHAAWSSQLKKVVALSDSVTVYYNYETEEKMPVPEQLRKAVEVMEG